MFTLNLKKKQKNVKILNYCFFQRQKVILDDDLSNKKPKNVAPCGSIKTIYKKIYEKTLSNIFQIDFFFSKVN